MKKLLTVNYNYGFNETNDYLDVVSLCLFIFDYYYQLNNEILFNVLKIKNNVYNNNINENNNTYSKTQPLIYKKEQPNFNHTTYNMNTMHLNDLNKNSSKKLFIKPESKIMLISILSGHNIVKPNSDFTSRPNCYFVLEFDDKNYTSDVVMNSSQPNFNEELEIKINAEEYLQKLNALNIYISVFSFVDENNSILIGKCEINPAKMFPFLNENNECEDFFHIIGEQGQVMGQLDLKFKFEKYDINNAYKYSFGNLNENNKINKKNNNTISYPLNNVFEKKAKNNFMKTGNEADFLHQRLQEAMNTIDDLNQILKNKVENEQKEKFNKTNNINKISNINMNINNNNDINMNEEEMVQNENGDFNGEEEIQEQEFNEEEMIEGYEEQVDNEENDFQNMNNDNNNLNDNGNNNINNNININININGNINDNNNELLINENEDKLIRNKKIKNKFDQNNKYHSNYPTRIQISHLNLDNIESNKDLDDNLSYDLNNEDINAIQDTQDNKIIKKKKHKTFYLNNIAKYDEENNDDENIENNQEIHTKPNIDFKNNTFNINLNFISQTKDTFPNQRISSNNKVSKFKIINKNLSPPITRENQHQFNSRNSSNIILLIIK